MFVSAAMVFAQEAQNEKVLHEQEAVVEQELQESAPVITVKVEEPVIAKVEEKKEEKKSEYPKIKQSGAVFITPRMEIVGYKNVDGENSNSAGSNLAFYPIKNKDGEIVGTDTVKIDKFADANRRRLMFGWSYKLNVAVNEKLDLNFRLTDPEGDAGTTIAGSGVGSTANNAKLTDMLGVMLPNAYFTWKPAKVFNLSGGLLDFAGYSSIDLETSWEQKDPTKAYNNTYWNSLAGFNFSFPVAPVAKIFLTAGITDNTYYRTPQIGYKDATDKAEKDTIMPYSNGRIMLGADISLAEKKISLKPVFSVKTRGDILKSDSTRNSDRKPVLTEGIDMSFKIVKPFSLNASVSAIQDNQNDSTANYSIVGAGVEPVLTFGGENGKLFTFRFKYAFDVVSNIGDKAVKSDANTMIKSDVSSFMNHIDTRFSIAVNDKMSIAPRFRYWGNNGLAWYGRATSDYRIADANKPGEFIKRADNQSARSQARFELAFATSF